MRNILIVGSGAPAGSLSESYIRAFRSLGISVESFDLDAFRINLPRTSLTNRIIHRIFGLFDRSLIRVALRRHLSCRRYGVIIIFKGAEFSRVALDSFRIRSPGSVWININPDDPFAAMGSDIEKSISFYDIYCIWSKRLLQRLKDGGCRNVQYLPFGFDPDSHKPLLGVPGRRPDQICFVGAWDKQRENFLERLAGHNLVIYGDAWHRVRGLLAKKTVPRDLHGGDYAKVISESAVSLNLMRPQNETSHNMRTFEIPAVGGLMLTTRSEEQDEIFPENKACLMFSDPDELLQKVNWVLENPEQAEAIRIHGMKCVQGHSYVARAQQLMDFITHYDAVAGGKA